MDFFKINISFYLSYWLHLLLIVCGDIKLNPGTGSDRRVLEDYSLIFVVFMPIWMSWLWLNQILMFWLVPSLKSLIAAIC